jgi:NADH:ubiquinone oxidoreductase subunit 6 (chain J)
VLGAEFVAVLLIIVYMGAISILFLFVVMMLNLRVMQLYAVFNNYFPIISFIGLFFIFQFGYIIYMIFGFFKLNGFFVDNLFDMWVSVVFYKGNASYVGWVLYNFFSHFVLLAGIVLLVSMIGVIVLTVDFQYRPVKKKEAYILVRRDISAVSFWRSKV